MIGLHGLFQGILGTVNSGKSALVHRYLTGSYMQEESPEGGRFKKEVIIEGQSYLLLIRDEGGPPEMQVSRQGGSGYLPTVCHLLSHLFWAFLSVTMPGTG